MGIIAYGNCRNLTINGNTIVITSNGGYVYGIDSSAYKEAFAPSRNNGFNYIIRNNKVLISGTNSMGSGIYLDELIGVLLKITLLVLILLVEITTVLLYLILMHTIYLKYFYFR